jgi:Methyltransferase FkbM domain
MAAVKDRLLSGERRSRRVPVGLYRNIILDLDLKSQSQVYCGLWERETHGFIRRAATKADWVIDVGAGRGELCLYFLVHRPVTRIVAIEPNASEIRALEKNLQLNRFSSKDLSVFQKFASTIRGPESMRLDDVEVNRNRAGFVKIDVDGAELDVLESGSNLLTGGKMDILIETHSASLEDSCIHWLRNHHFACHVIKNAWWRFAVPETRPIAHNRWLWANSLGSQ